LIDENKALALFLLYVDLFRHVRDNIIFNNMRSTNFKKEVGTSHVNNIIFNNMRRTTIGTCNKLVYIV
jgi:hypothetical protein